MDEKSLKKLPINDLINLMVKSVNELLELHKTQNQQEMVSKSKEVQLLQKLIAVKRAEFLPLK